MDHGTGRFGRAGWAVVVTLATVVLVSGGPAGATSAPTTTTPPTSVKASGSDGGGTFSPSGATLGNGGAQRVGARTAFGVTLRVWVIAIPTGGIVAPNGPIPRACFPDQQILVEYSTSDLSSAIPFEARHDLPLTPMGQIVGLAETHPTAIVLARVPAGSRRVEMRFTSGHTDSTGPFPGGWAVLSSPLTAIARHPVPLLTDRPAVLGRLTVIDRTGHRRAFGSVASNAGVGFTPTACLNQRSLPVPATAAPPPLALPQPTGSPPADQAGARQAIEGAYHRLFETSAYSSDAADLEGPPPLSDAERTKLQQGYGDITGKLKVRVNDVRFLSPTAAALSFDLLLNGQPITQTTVGRALLVNGQWKVARVTFCEIVGRGGIHCQ